MFRHAYQNQQLENEIKYWKQLAQSYLNKIQELEKKVDTLISDRLLFEQKMEGIKQSKSAITIQNLKVNQIQSGAAFNIAENLYCSTKSDMDMDLGPNSMNVGDSNNMEHLEHNRVKLGNPHEKE